MASNPPLTNIKLLSATQIPAGPGGSNCTGGWPSCAQTISPYPAVLGDFLGNTKQQVAAVVQAHHPFNPAISVEVPGAGGTFTPKLTPVTTPLLPTNELDPIFVGSLKTPGTDDLVMVHTSLGNIEVFLSNGDGTFTSQGTTPVTTGLLLGGALAKDPTTGYLDLVLVDGSAPGNAWTLLGNGDGTFQAATPTALNIQLESDNPFNTVVFGNFANHSNGLLDFAANGASPNKQVNVFINNGSGYNSAVPLSTPDGYYDSCFNTAGNLSTTSGPPDLVSANCFDNYITVYVNNGSGIFAQGVYYGPPNYPPVFGSPTAVSVANLRGNGTPNDIVSTNGQSGDVSILLGNGDGTVDVGSIGFVTGGQPSTPAITIADPISGKVDLMVPDGEFSFAYLKGNGDGTFGPDVRSGVNYYAPTGNGPHAQGASIASGDFNGDGIPDFVIGNTNAQSPSPNAGITVFLSNPDGTYQPGVNYSSPNAMANLQYVAVADFNGDGKLDIAATDGVNGGVQIFTGNGDGTFTAASAEIPTDSGTYTTLGIVAADFNGDGWPDIAVVNNPTATTADVGVLLNDGKTGSFGSPTNYALSNVATEIAAGNLGSGKISLAVPLYGTSGNPGSAVAIFAGNGNGTFNTTPTVVSLVNSTITYYNPYAVAIGDLNGDGIPDLAVTIQDQSNTNQCNSGNTPCQGIAVVLQNPVGTFAAPVLLPTTLQDPYADSPVPASVVIADMNGDGIPDLVYTNSEFGTAGILYGKGAGAFYDPVEFPASRWAYNLAVTGVNSVASKDVVVAGWENSLDFSGITVLMNTGDTGTTAVSSGTPSAVGNSVTFTATVSTKVKGVSGVPSGTVSFYDGSTLLGQGTLSSGTATYSTPAGAQGLGVGSHNITAVYSGDGGMNFLPSTSSVLTQTVIKASAETSTPVGSPNPAPPKQSVTFTATVTSINSPLPPTGNVIFYDAGKQIGTGPLISGKATYSTTSLTVGSHSITAAYGGDSNFDPSSQSSALTEVIAVPDYTLASNPTIQTVSAGSSAKYTITLTPSTGYDGQVSFACPKTLPTGVSCAFAPNPLTSTGTGPVTSVLTITTTAASAALVAPADVDAIHGNLNLLASLSALGLMGMVLTGDWKKRKLSGRFVIMAVIALVMVLAWAGCGGGSSSSSTTPPPPTGGTPSGSYPLALLATGTAGTNGGNTSQHPLSVTLVVQ
jgi:hypothetical protein